MTDKDLADLWVEWDHYCTDLVQYAGCEPGYEPKGWKLWDEGNLIRNYINAYAGQRLINRSLSH